MLWLGIWIGSKHRQRENKLTSLPGKAFPLFFLIRVGAPVKWHGWSRQVVRRDGSLSEVWPDMGDQ